MSRNYKGVFAVVAGSKGGIGKSTISKHVVVPLLYEVMKKPIKLIEVDDNNVSIDLHRSEIFFSKNFKVDVGIDETLKTMFDILGDESVVIDAGGGNDSNKLVDALLSMQIPKHTVYFLPFQKNKSGMKNFKDMYYRIRKSDKEALIVAIANQSESSNKKDREAEHPFFFGNKSLGVEGIYNDIKSDKNLIVTSLLNSNVYDLAEGFGFTSYEIATSNINVGKFIEEKNLKSLQAKSDKEKNEIRSKAISFVSVYNECLENHKNSLLPFFKDVEL